MLYRPFSGYIVLRQHLWWFLRFHRAVRNKGKTGNKIVRAVDGKEAKLVPQQTSGAEQKGTRERKGNLEITWEKKRRE